MTTKDLIQSKDPVNQVLGLTFLFEEHGKSFETFLIACKWQLEDKYINKHDVHIMIHLHVNINTGFVVTYWTGGGLATQVKIEDETDCELFLTEHFNYKPGTPILTLIKPKLKDIYHFLNYNNLL